MFPVSPAFCPCLVWVVTERGGEGGDCVIRWRIVIDKLWSKVTENERKTRGKQSRKRLPDIQLRVCLDLSVGPLPSLLIYWTYAPLTFATPSSLCSDGAVGEWSERTAEDAGPGEPQLLHTGEEDLRVEPPAADTAIRLGQLYERWRDVCVFRRVFTHNKDAENANFRCMFWDGSHYSKFWSKLMFLMLFQEQITSTWTQQCTETAPALWSPSLRHLVSLISNTTLLYAHLFTCTWVEMYVVVFYRLRAWRPEGHHRRSERRQENPRWHFKTGKWPTRSTFPT